MAAVSHAISLCLGQPDGLVIVRSPGTTDTAGTKEARLEQNHAQQRIQHQVFPTQQRWRRGPRWRAAAALLHLVPAQQ